jgi:hypothetical protein
VEPTCSAWGGGAALPIWYAKANDNGLTVRLEAGLTFTVNGIDAFSPEFPKISIYPKGPSLVDVEAVAAGTETVSVAGVTPYMGVIVIAVCG